MKVSRQKAKTKRFAFKKNRRLFLFICGFIFLLYFCGFFIYRAPQKVAAEDVGGEIEEAIFTREEFFGAQAIVPFPTAQARENLSKIAENNPDNPQLLKKLAELDEKLGRFYEAEKNLLRLAEINPIETENLAAFYERRGQFEKQAETLKKNLFSVSAEKRGDALEKLIFVARRHDLKKYLQTSFYADVAKENPNVYPVFERLIGNLIEEKFLNEALGFIRRAKAQFPERKDILLEKEIEVLLESGKSQEAEQVYQAAFDPFWSDERARKFYDFLSNHDRLRAYGAEIKARFGKNPAAFDAGVRLALYRNNDYYSGNDSVAPIMLKLQQTKKDWTTDELVIAARLLLKSGEAELASRFIYTLYLREDFKQNFELRAKILYQLFELFFDAENQKLPLVRGDLRFYEDIARSDAKPGITSGILSLIFSDTDPGERLDDQEAKTVKLFNRAAAYRIFEEYKKENPNSDELAQMYLDLVRFYSADKQTEIAEKLLNEFAENYKSSKDFPSAALKLADAFVAVKREDKAREVYQKILDYLGEQNITLAPKKEIEEFQNDFSEPKIDAQNAESRNKGINIPGTTTKTEYGNNYYYAQTPKLNDYLARKKEEIYYDEVLEKYVASLAAEKKTTEILAFYSDEIAKHPDEEWLYERRLGWLEQTNLTSEQLELFKTALARFKTNQWRDKLARFFVRNKRNDEFAALSEEIIGSLSDAESQKYLTEFIDGNGGQGDFEKRLYLRLYRAAHERFPHNISFVKGLLRFYKIDKQTEDWRRLSAEYYFESAEIRDAFLDDLSSGNQLRNFLEESKNHDGIIYDLFRADASARLADYENSVAAYRHLNELYPHTPEFANRLIDFTRSFGQKDRQALKESAIAAAKEAEFQKNSNELQTQIGELYAELGDYEKAREQWKKLLETAKGDKETYLETATVFWDYFQFADARETINILREKFGDDTLYAFQTGAILEAQNKKSEAISEYIKAFDASDDETQKEKSVKRLVHLYRKTEADKNASNELQNQIAAAFSVESKRRKDAAYLSLGYAEFLFRIDREKQGETILNRAIGQNADSIFLESARDLYRHETNKTGEQIAIKRLAETEKSPRRQIGYALQLANAFAEEKKRVEAKNALDELVGKFPTNYGVITETSDFYARLGFENEAANVLENALPKSRGAYRNAIAGKLASRLIRSNRLDSAEAILENLHNEEKANTEIFDELARVYVRTNKPEKMRTAFAETISEIKNSDLEPREMETTIADLRTEMIEGFTKLKDHKSAIEQHIEIINREPENEELTENAIRYVERYGGAETLVNYYEKTAAESFKNYRWNVVLARIFAANKDDESAIKNYQTAIGNQPELPELYEAVADLETKRGNYDEALKNIDEVLTLTGNENEKVKKKIEILKKANRLAEIETEKAKLPAEEEKKADVNLFEEAQRLRFAEKEKAREIYRQAFDKLSENPLSGEMKTADITGFVQTMRDEESLDRLDEKLWNLREKLIEIASENDSNDAGEAKKRLVILESAMIESIGATAKNFGTDEELENLHERFSRKIEEEQVLNPDSFQTISLIQNLCNRAGFGDLEESILITKIEANKSLDDKPVYLRNLVNFYNERGAYRKTFDALEKFGGGDLPLKAKTAKLVGDIEKELESLRLIYWKIHDKPEVSENEFVARFLEILYEKNPGELKSLTEKSSAHQLHLINFLIGKGEKNLAHAAITNSGFSTAWKVSRNAETSLALREFDENSECYFCEALQFETIGEMVRQTPDKKRFLINDDWFRLTREYGEWLVEKNDSKNMPAKYLTAMIEIYPRSANEQTKLGEFYLERGQLKSAIEHLRLAIEAENSVAVDKKSLILLGAAYSKIGRRDFAEQVWTRALTDAEIVDANAFFQILQKYDLSEIAREKIAPTIVETLETSDVGNLDELQNLIRTIANSFDDESKKSAYFQAILQKRPTDLSLAKMLVNETLIGENDRNTFYEIIIDRSRDLDDRDYGFATVAQRSWSKIDAESVYRQENNYKTDEPENGKYIWKKNYLDFLIERKDYAEAAPIIAEIEKDLDTKYARPSWLFAAKINLQIHAGKIDRAEISRVAGITVSDSATEIIAPDIEFFNDILRVLKEQNRNDEAIVLSENYFARMLALRRYEQENFIGLARVFFQKGETEKALNTLRLLIETANENTRQKAYAEIASIDAVKENSASAEKFTEREEKIVNLENALRTSAELAFEFGQTDYAISLRRQLIEANPADISNKLELAKILTDRNDDAESENILTQIAGDKNAPRTMRWNARRLLNGEIPNIGFDAFSQFYLGNVAEKSDRNQAAEYYVRALIADKDAEIPALQSFIKSYALTEKPYAAFELFTLDKTKKSDELLRELSQTAETIGDFGRAVEFEKLKTNFDAERISALQKLDAEKNSKATDFKVDPENTRKL